MEAQPLVSSPVKHSNNKEPGVIEAPANEEDSASAVESDDVGDFSALVKLRKV